jgi:tRNA(fMet)-specific endonuclease VapC
MALRLLIDTDIFIHVRQRKADVIARFKRVPVGDAAISVITYGELIYGVQKSAQRDRAIESLTEMIGLLPVLALPEGAASTYGEIRAALEAKGETIGNNDLWIAAHAKAAGLTLVTSNVREFSRIKTLKIETWVRGAKR